jgi:hypothetical protein
MSNKLQYRYTGPHTVTEVFNPVTYKVSIDGFSRIVHANRMKRDNRREASRKRIQQHRRTILRANPNGTRHLLTPTTTLNPTAEANLLASSIRMMTDEFEELSISQLTAAYGVYDEEVDLMESNPEDHQRSLQWLSEPSQHIRKPHPYNTNSLLATSATLHAPLPVPLPQAFTRSPSDCWSATPPANKEPHTKVDLYGQGCLWHASKPDDGPYNGLFHASNECCKYCEMR